MNIYIHEFRMLLRSVIIWSVSAVLLMLLYMSMFTMMAENAELMNETLSQFPPELLVAFGLTGVDLSTVLGFFSFLFLFTQLMLAIQASNYGFGILSMEERELTADFLLAKPVTRTTILTSKFLAALTGLTITNAVVWISSFALIEIFRGDKTYDVDTLVLLLLSIVPFQLVFFATGMLISLLVKRVRNVTPYSMALAFGMYVLSTFGGMIGDDKLEVITPFKHFDAHYIVSNKAYDPTFLISVALILISIIGSYVLFQRRNIPAPV